MLKKIFLCLMLNCLGVGLIAQTDTLVRFTSNFQFKDGIYFSIEEFLDNCPGLESNKLYDKKGRQVNGLWTEHKKLYYKDSDSLFLLSQKDVWGYSDRGKVYLVRDGRQKRLQIIGAMCHIVLIEEVEEFTDQSFGRDRYNNRSIIREVSQEFMIDFEKGEMLEFNMENFMEVLSRDDKLFTEFEKIQSRKVKQQMKFHFLTRYNDAHPIYFSVSQCKKVEE